MSDGAISQDEIDALLAGVDMGGLSGSAGSKSLNIDLTVLEKFANDISDEVLSKINSMTDSEFTLSSPTVETSDRDQFLAKLPEMVVAVMGDFSTGLKGDHLFVLSPEFSQKLTGLINKEEHAELDDMALSVISEVVANHTGTEINVLSKDGKLPGLATFPPESVHVPKAMVRIPQNKFVLWTYTFKLQDESYVLWEAVSADVANGMISALGGGNDSSTGALNASELGNLMGSSQPQNAVPNMGMNQMGQMGMNQMPAGGMQQPMMNQMGMNAMGMGGMPMGGAMMQQPVMMNPPNVQAIQYPNLMGGAASSEQGNIGLIMDVFMEMTVELGRTKKPIKEILGMGEGTIIELDKLAGEPVDILVNHKPIAKGEVVVIDENFGVRVTEILSPTERVSDLH